MTASAAKIALALIGYGALGLAPALATAAAAAAAVDPVLATARELRALGCNGRPGIRSDLTRDRRLDDVARRWATGGGDHLDTAFESAGVRTRQSASLAIIGKSLHHKSPVSTAVYARLDLDPVRASIDRATAAMWKAAGISENSHDSTREACDLSSQLHLRATALAARDDRSVAATH